VTITYQFPFLDDVVPTVAGCWDPKLDFIILDKDEAQVIANKYGVEKKEVLDVVYNHECLHRVFIPVKLFRDIFDFNTANFRIVFQFNQLESEIKSLEENLKMFLYANAIAVRRLLLEALPLLEAHAKFCFENNSDIIGILAKKFNFLQKCQEAKNVYKELMWLYEKTEKDWFPSKIIGSALNYDTQLRTTDLIYGVPIKVSPIERFDALMQALKVLHDRKSLSERSEILNGPKFEENSMDHIMHIVSPKFQKFMYEVEFIAGIKSGTFINKQQLTEQLPGYYEKMLNGLMDHLDYEFLTTQGKIQEFQYPGMLFAIVENGRMFWVPQKEKWKQDEKITMGMMHLNITHLVYQILSGLEPTCIFSWISDCGCAKPNGSCGYQPYVRSAAKIKNILEKSPEIEYEMIWSKLKYKLT